jgi:ankyrin repeat domain-containing protein 17
MSHNRSVDQAFARAISAADFDEAGRLLKEGVDINRVIPTIEPDERAMYEGTTTYLVDVASRGLVETVRFLLQHGANPNMSIDSVNPGQTALLAAASGGHAKVVDLLLEYGADFSARDHPTKFSAMDYAISNENAAIVRSLLTAGAPPIFRRLSFDRDGGAEAREIVRVLMQHGFDINKRDDWGRTPLMWAADHAPLETVHILMDSGADVNAVSGKNMNGVSSNETALLLARRQKRSDVIDILLRRGARETKPRGRFRKLMGW